MASRPLAFLAHVMVAKNLNKRFSWPNFIYQDELYFVRPNTFFYPALAV